MRRMSVVINYSPHLTRFRKDLLITETTDPETTDKSFWVKNPDTGEAFEFGEEEFFLCQAMDGTSTPEQILAAFNSRFDLVLTTKDFEDFAQQIGESGLLESFVALQDVTPLHPGHQAQAPPEPPNTPPQRLPKALLVLIGLGTVFFCPYFYRAGGDIQLLPPRQFALQAQVDSQITRVFYPGGDQQQLKAGTVVALAESVTTENEVKTTTQAVHQQAAVVSSLKYQLQTLLDTPRPDNIKVAQAQVAVARQAVVVAQKRVQVVQAQAQTAADQAEFSAREAARYHQLYNEGVSSLQTYENAEKQAETDHNNTLEKEQAVLQAQQAVAESQQSLGQAIANLNLVLAGPPPDQIEADRWNVKAGEALLRQLKQQLSFYQDQVHRTTLVMPITGRLVTPYLKQKVGIYLKQGDTFAVVEDSQHMTGEVRIPEENAADFKLGAPVEVKLLAYPDTPITGRVVAIQPAATIDTTAPIIPTDPAVPSSRSTTIVNPVASSTSRVVRVLVQLPNPNHMLKASMSGYAKIASHSLPVIDAFTRPLVTFIRVDVWSWLP